MMLRSRKVVVKGSKTSVKKIEKHKKVSFRIEDRTKPIQKHTNFALRSGTGLCQGLTQCDCISDIFQPSSSSSDDSTESEQNVLSSQVAECSFPASPSFDSSSSQTPSESSQTTEDTVKSDTKEDFRAADTASVEVVPIDVGDSSDFELQTETEHPSINSVQTPDTNYSSEVIVLVDSPVSPNIEKGINQSTVLLDSPVSSNTEKTINQSIVFLDSPVSSSIEKKISQSTHLLNNPVSASTEKMISPSTVLLDSPVFGSRKKIVNQSTSVDDPRLPSVSRKRKNSEDSGVEILFAVAGGKRKRQCRSQPNIIVDNNLRSNIIKDNFTISITGNDRKISPLCQREINNDVIQISSNKGSTVGDDVIFVGNDDEVSVIDTGKAQTSKEQYVQRHLNTNSVNNEKDKKYEPLGDDVIILDSPSSQTPEQSSEKKSKRMVSVSTSVTGLIPHYTHNLLDFIPIGEKAAPDTPKMAIHRHTKAVGRHRRRWDGRNSNKRWDGRDSNRPHNLNTREQQRVEVVQKHVTKSQNSDTIPPPLNCARSFHSDTAESSSSSSLSEKQQPTQSAPEVPQSSTSTTGTNIYNPNANEKQSCGLRPVIIDGNNIAMGHGKGTFFSWRGLHICIKYFLNRGHKVTAFVPTFRRGACPPDLRSEMDQYERNGEVVFTPSRRVDGRLIVPYDDRFIVQCAAELGGVIVSTDNYRDLLQENSSWKETIERRLLMFTWVGDLLMFPNDPLGRNGPNLEEFLQFPSK